MDVYGIITEKIITLLEQGVVPWRRPWTATGLPRNLVSMKPYRGINYCLLSASKYISPYWLTMRQANELGGHVRRGEESTAIRVLVQPLNAHGQLATVGADMRHHSLATKLFAHDTLTLDIRVI
jgi:antirestriction protein ArdC